MLILGTTETIQLIDGADGLPTMQALRHVDQVVALGAPALAGARDAIIGEPAGPTQTRLKNRLEGILRKTREDLGSGLFAAPPPTDCCHFRQRVLKHLVRSDRA